MKYLLVLGFIMVSLTLSAQSLHNGHLVIRASFPKASYVLGSEPNKYRWGVDPTLREDILEIPFNKPVRVGFVTDKDSLFHLVKDEVPFYFYIQVADTAYALNVIQGIRMEKLKFTQRRVSKKYRFWHNDSINSAYLTTLRERYKLPQLIQGLSSDTARVLRIVNWVHNQWPHNGSNMPQKSDALSILEEVKSGKNFRCTEYSIVTAAALKALGYKARMMYIYTSNVESSEAGASHVVMEVFLKDMGKWVMLDGQYDVMPLLNKVPLNTVELQRAIVKHYDKLEIRSLTGITKRYYSTWIYPYLFFFETSFDNREGKAWNEKVDGLRGIRLGPKGSKNPTKFQRQWPISNAAFTHNYNDLYKHIKH